MINENPELKDVFPEPPMAALRQGPPNSPKYQEIPNEHHTETQLDGRDAVKKNQYRNRKVESSLIFP